MARKFLEAFSKLQRGEVELAALLPESDVQAACAAADYQDQATVYTATTTVHAFAAQMLRADRSCQQTVSGVVAQRVLQEHAACSANTGGYCKARQRIPEQVYQRLLEQSGAALDAAAPAETLWNGRSVRVVDGSTLHLADTPENRQEYPLQQGLTAGCHYPVVRILAVFSLAMGCVLRAALRPYQGKGTGETGMLRDLVDAFAAGDILLGDRYFAGFWDLAWWTRRGVDVVTRLPASRRADFRRGRRLGRDDHLVQWQRTARPQWLTPEEAASFPDCLTLREVRVRVTTPGFRTKEVIVVTTLTDAQAYSAEQIADLYRRRWQAELNFRSLKTHMEMDYLRTKRPATVRKEFAMHLLAYNSVRRVAAEAAHAAGLSPCEISFKGTLQTMHEFLARLSSAPDHRQWIDQWLATTAQLRVGGRPNRVEPYALKRRPKEYPPLQEPRSKYKTRLCKTA